MQIRFIRLIVRLASALLVFGFASAPAHATEPDPIDIVQVGEQLPVCNDPVLNLSVALADPQMPEPPDAAALQEEVDGGWVTVPYMAGDFFDEVAGNFGVVYLHREFIAGEEANLRVIVYAHEGVESTVWGPKRVSLSCDGAPSPTQTATPPSRPSAEQAGAAGREALDRLREQQAETITPTQGVMEKVAATSTATPSQTATALVTGPVVETDVVDGSPSTTTWVLRRIAPLAMVLSLHLYLWTMVGNGGLMGLVSVRRRH